MPRRDGTGPMGMGVKTGRGAGLCNVEVNQANSVTNPYLGGYAYGYGCGCGNKRGYQRQFVATGIPGYARNDFAQNRNVFNEKDMLSQQEIALENQLKLVKGRLSELKNEDE